MRLYFYQTPSLLKKIYRNCTWSRATDEKVIYLTFDDGPVEVATPEVLQILKTYNARATFFMVGDNVVRYPEIFDQVLKEDHAIGNHTYNHLKGWSTNDQDYIENVEKCQEVIESRGYKRNDLPLFRPPYGRIKLAQLAVLSRDYDIIMWQILSGDFDLRLNIQQSMNALTKAKGGDIVVFHDSDKYLKNVRELLPKFLNHYTNLGFRFESL
jgi:peptidoglycan/xylan/chitin deacetylase (PgdA/CDA1 family)